MDEPMIPWTHLKAFVRQHTHDLRNDLNSLDLEATLLHELVPAGEARTSVERIQRQLRGLAKQLKQLSSHFQSSQSTLSPLPAKVLLSIWREKHAAMADAPTIHWNDHSGDAVLDVDVEMMATAFQELLNNAAAYGKGAIHSITALPEGDRFCFEMMQSSDTTLDPSAWQHPFGSMKRCGYGLGLFTTRRMIKANDGELQQIFDPQQRKLITRIRLPVKRKESQND